MANIKILPGRRRLAGGLILAGAAIMLVAGCRFFEEGRPETDPAASHQQIQRSATLEQKRTDPPPHKVLKHSDNGTPARMKGENLAGDFSPESAFQKALTHKDHSKMVFLWLERYKDFFKLNDPQKEFRIEKITPDDLGGTHVKMQQVVNGLPVWGRTMLLHFNKENAIYLFQGNYVPEPLLSGVNTTAVMPVSDAEARALAAVSGAPSQWKVQARSMVVFITPDNTARPAYALTLARGLADRYLYLVDAADGRILHKISLVRTGAAPLKLN